MKAKGKIDKIVHSDEKTAFCIARVLPIEKDFDSKYLSSYENYSVLGTGYLMEGMEYEFEGEWKKSSYGYTLNFSSYEKLIPNDVEGISCYIQTFKGIGPSTAKRIVEKYGIETLEVMEKTPERLLEIKGISRDKLHTITDNFNRNKGFEDLSKFTAKYGITGKKTTQIYERFGDGAEKLINENPYILCDEIDRISFLTSDLIARKMGFPLDHIYRLKAGVLHILKKQCYEGGHLFLYEDELSKFFNKLFPNIDMIRFEEILEVLESKEQIARIDSKDKIYLPKLLKMEDYVARKTIKLCGSSNSISQIDKYIDEIQKANNITYDREQIKGISSINSGSSFNIITGGPGTGKSTIIKAILGVLLKNNSSLRIKLAAPTGRAAKRMEEATGYKASTIHRLLEYNPMEGFTRNSKNPLDADVLIVDESSMLDMELFCNLINAIGEKTLLFLVGDTDQLPPVGIGYVFRDLIESEIVPVVKLNKVFRQGEGSIIKVNSKNINQGITQLEQEKGAFELYCYKKQEDRSDILKVQQAIVELFKIAYNKELKKDRSRAIYQVQILSPMKKSALGINALNNIIQNVYNPKSSLKEEFSFYNIKKEVEVTYREGDKVMQIVNNYDKNVFNGDLGIIQSINGSNILIVFEDGTEVSYEKAELRDNIVLAYAVTVHKSQGSEFNNVIVVTSYLHSIMRQRNLYYTAITRAKETVYTVGDLQSIYVSIKTLNAAIRNSKLKERLDYYKERAA